MLRDTDVQAESFMHVCLCQITPSTAKLCDPTADARVLGLIPGSCDPLTCSKEPSATLSRPSSSVCTPQVGGAGTGCTSTTVRATLAHCSPEWPQHHLHLWQTPSCHVDKSADTQKNCIARRRLASEAAVFRRLHSATTQILSCPPMTVLIPDVLPSGLLPAIAVCHTVASLRLSLLPAACLPPGLFFWGGRKIRLFHMAEPTDLSHERAMEASREAQETRTRAFHPCRSPTGWATKTPQTTGEPAMAPLGPFCPSLC